MIELLFMGLAPPKPQPIFQPEPIKIEKKVKRPLTVEQKIKLNYYKCAPNQYIRKDNARCLDKPKPVQTPAPVQKPAVAPVFSSDNTYTPGQCTWHVKNMNPRVPNGWGDATDWKWNAQNQGWTVSDTPVVGAVAWRYGHVAVVVEVGDGVVTISEMNYNWTPYAQRTITIPAHTYQYLY